MSDLESRLRRRYAGQAPAAGFDARVLARIQSVASLARPLDAQVAQRRAAEVAAHYADAQARLRAQRRAALFGVVVAGALLWLVVNALGPFWPLWADGVARYLGEDMPAQMNVGGWLLVLAAAVWLAVSQPRIFSRR